MRVSDEMLALLIASLEQYRDEGVWDPWILVDGRTVDPLDALLDLRDERVPK